MRYDVDTTADATPVAASEHATPTASADTGAADATIVTLDEADDEIDAGDDEADTDAEAKPEAAPDAAGERPKRSRARRYKDRIARLERELAEARRAPRLPVHAADDELVAPDERDFANDYLAYDRALRDYQMRKAIRDEHHRQAERQAEHERRVAHRDRVGAYQRRLDDVRERIPDFEEAMRAGTARGAAIRHDVRDLVMDSPKGPLLAYYLATNPDVLDDLNGMSPAAAAKTIGSLEARIRGPRPKLQTDAKPAREAPKGGATPGRSYAEMSMEEFIAARQREQRK